MNSFNQPLPIPATYWPPPDLSQAAFIAPNAVVMGAVEVAFGVSIWYGAVVRGDIERIILGAYTNIQDGAILHGDPGTLTLLEDYVTVGHRAVIHAAHIERGCLIGIGSVILDGVRIGEGSIIGAGSVVTKDIPPFSLVKGIPGQRTGHISEAKAQELIEHAHAYQKLALVHSGRGTELGFPKVNP